MMDLDRSLLEKVEAALHDGSHLEVLPQVLDQLLERFACTTGTVHLLDEQPGMLKLVAQRGIPEIVLDKIKIIPVGKGMAGIAAGAPCTCASLQFADGQFGGGETRRTRHQDGRLGGRADAKCPGCPQRHSRRGKAGALRFYRARMRFALCESAG